MKRPEHFPENIFNFKIIFVPPGWQKTIAIRKQLCGKEGRKEARKEGRKERKKEGNIWHVSISTCMCTYAQKTSPHFLIRILLGINILGAAIVHKNIQKDTLLVSFIR